MVGLQGAWWWRSWPGGTGRTAQTRVSLTPRLRLPAQNRSHKTNNTSISHTQQQVQFSCLFSHIGGGVYALTIGRGTSAAPDTSFVNLANGIAFSDVELSIYSVNDLDTSLWVSYHANTNAPQTAHASFLDQPGAGTWHYAARFLHTSSGTSEFRQCRFTLLVLPA